MQAGKIKGMEKLNNWSTNIVNHFCKSSNGDIKALKVCNMHLVCMQYCVAQSFMVGKLGVITSPHL